LKLNFIFIRVSILPFRFYICFLTPFTGFEPTLSRFETTLSVCKQPNICIADESG
jgi:hypothetical protein